MNGEDDQYELVTPFWTDTDGYTDRDRVMFAAGFEFAELRRAMIACDCEGSRVIQTENESRVRMLCARYGYTCAITPCDNLDEMSLLTLVKR